MEPNRDAGLRAGLAPELLVALRRVLEEAKARGFLGPGPIDPHIDRAIDLSGGVENVPHRALDLGSGGGLPGLVLAALWRESQWVLLEGSTTRSRFLSWAVQELGMDEQVAVEASRAEVAGRTDLRAQFDLVTARSFGAPAVTAECAAPFLTTGGILVVAEPPGGLPERWDEEGLDKLGLKSAGSQVSPTAYQRLRQVRPCPDEFPRRVGIPAKRPIF